MAKRNRTAIFKELLKRGNLRLEDHYRFGHEKNLTRGKGYFKLSYFVHSLHDVQSSVDQSRVNLHALKCGQVSR